MKEYLYWDAIRELAKADRHVEVPQHTIDTALAIFKPKKVEGLNPLHVFRPVQMAAGMVRRAQPAQKFHYELNQSYFVRLEQTWNDEGICLAAMVEGLEDGDVTLFQDENIVETQVNEGVFEFEGLAPGCYTMCLSCGGEFFWIKDLELKAQNMI